MKKSKVSNFALLAFMLAGSAAFAQMDRGEFKTSEPKKLNLLEESTMVTVLNETSVQVDKDPSRRIYGVSYGQLQAENLTLTSYEHSVKYDLSKPMDMVGADFSYLPWEWNGHWGAKGGASYGYLDNEQGSVKTKLHVAMGELLFMYRGEWNRKSWVKPLAGIGGTVITVFQKGRDEYNTSEARGMYVGLLGAGLNLNRVFRLRSGLDWEMVAQYKRLFGPSKPSANWNGTVYTAGLSIAL